MIQSYLKLELYYRLAILLSIGGFIGAIASLFGHYVIVFNGKHVSGINGFLIGIVYSITPILIAHLYTRYKQHAK